MPNFDTITAYPADLTVGDLFQVGAGQRWLTVTGPPEPSDLGGCVDIPCVKDDGEEIVSSLQRGHLVTKRWDTPAS